VTFSSSTQKSIRESTNIDNLFFVGTCTQGRDRKAASSFIHGFRYSAKCLALMLNHLRHGAPLPQEVFNGIKMEQIAKFIQQRLSTTSALYQLNYGVLCDILTFSPEEDVANKKVETLESIKGSAKYYYELPTEWALNQPAFKNQEHLWVVLLKDGKTHFPETDNAFAFTTPPPMLDFDLPCQAFIHPVIRRYRFGELTSEVDIGGNFVVRLDQRQMNNDLNPKRSVDKLVMLMCDEMKINHDSLVDMMFTPADFKKTFTHWDAARIEKYRKEEIAKSAVAPCSYSINLPSGSALARTSRSRCCLATKKIKR
jgi:hypothetical protein